MEGKEKKALSWERELLMENLRLGLLLRTPVVVVLIILFGFIKLTFKPFPYDYLLFIFLVVLFSIVYPIGRYIQEHREINTESVRLILTVLFTFELLGLGVFLFLCSPVTIHYGIYTSFLCLPVLTFYSVWTYPFLLSEKHNNYFHLLSYFILIPLSVLEQSGMIFHYLNYSFPAGRLYPPYVLAIQISIGGIILFVFRSTMSHFWKRFIGLNFQLKELSDELEENVFQRTRELEAKSEELGRAKNILEVKVKERTKELEMALGEREQAITERTQELRKKVEELEKFQRVTIGRELKMRELKKEIEKLKNKR